MTTLTPTRLAAMPRVNLLPPEIAEAARLKRLKVMLGLVVAAAASIVVLMFIMASGQAAGAEDELADAEAQGSALDSKVAEYSEVPEVTNELTSAQTNLATAMTPEIRWSFYLNDLGMVMPQSSRLTTLTAENTAAAIQLDPTLAAVTPPMTPLGVPKMGSFTFTGKSTDFDAVANWLQTLSKLNGVAEPSVTSIAETEEDDTKGKFFDVESSAQLTPDAASGRYTTIAAGE